MCICMAHAVAMTTRSRDMTLHLRLVTLHRSCDLWILGLNYAVEWSTEQGCREKGARPESWHIGSLARENKTDVPV